MPSEKAIQIIHDMKTNYISCDIYGDSFIDERASELIDTHTDEATATLTKQRDMAVEALQDALGPLEYASSQFNNSRFTDRHFMGSKFRNAMHKVNETLAAIAAQEKAE